MKTLKNLHLGATLRITDRDGSPWFAAKDICDALGIGHTGSALRRLDDDEKGVHSIPTLGGSQEMSVVSESGLYALILRSDKPSARPFRKWVTAEVLPEIRRTGSYSGGWEAELARLEAENQSSAALMVEAAENLAAFREKILGRLGVASTAVALPSPAIDAACDLERAKNLFERLSPMATGGAVRAVNGAFGADGRVRIQAGGTKVLIAISPAALFGKAIAMRRIVQMELRRCKAWVRPPLEGKDRRHRFSMPGEAGSQDIWWLLDFERLPRQLQESFRTLCAADHEIFPG